MPKAFTKTATISMEFYKLGVLSFGDIVEVKIKHFA
jgi:hypothetical protein